MACGKAPEFTVEKLKIPVLRIDASFQNPVALGLQIIDPERPEKPLFPLPRGVLKEGEEVFLSGIDRVPEVDRPHAKRPLHFDCDLAHSACPEFPGPVEGCIVLDYFPLFECPQHGILLSPNTEVEPDFALVLGASIRGDDIIGLDSCCLDTIQRKEDALDNAALPGPIVAENPRYPVAEPYLLVPEPLEILEDKAVDDHGTTPACILQAALSCSSYLRVFVTRHSPCGGP
ncbi:MAG: hypothetical protein A4E42_00275 [Methanoregulaceae archaeon PtaU1.Bin222]|nr:MAG: hypothetical protein A4E42_00275 [Methanoregulaceae archaeon PtaU1.Bin222]